MGKSLAFRMMFLLTRVSSSTDYMRQSQTAKPFRDLESEQLPVRTTGHKLVRPRGFASLPRRMQVLLYHCLPFSLAHGGQQIQIERTLESLRQAGVQTEFLDWHRTDQRADILHFFGRISWQLLEHARQKEMQVVVSDLLGAQGARSASRRLLERAGRRMMEVFSRGNPTRLSWGTYREVDACIALTTWEAVLLRDLFCVSADRTHVVPNGVDPEFLVRQPAERGKWLLCVATITPVKRVLELAHAAVHAHTPLRFAGRAYSDSDPYFKAFLQFVRLHPELLRYDGAIAERAVLAQGYRQARGFVLLSRWESLSLAALEAAACECPLLLNDLPWARATFHDKAAYCPPEASTAAMAAHLRAFYDHAAEQPLPPPPLSWSEVGLQLAALYQHLARTK